MLRFSPVNKVTLPPLARYFSKVLNKGSLCIIVATPQRSRQLSRAIKREGVNLDEMMNSGQLVIIDADRITDISLGVAPDNSTNKNLTEVMAKLFSGSGRPVYTLREKSTQRRSRPGGT